MISQEITPQNEILIIFERPKRKAIAIIINLDLKFPIELYGFIDLNFTNGIRFFLLLNIT